jgi:hypothetical protein
MSSEMSGSGAWVLGLSWVINNCSAEDQLKGFRVWKNTEMI